MNLSDNITEGQDIHRHLLIIKGRYMDKLKELAGMNG